MIRKSPILILLSIISATWLFMVLLIFLYIIGENIVTILIHDRSNFLLSSDWSTVEDNPKFGILSLLYGSFITAFIASILSTVASISLVFFRVFYIKKYFISLIVDCIYKSLGFVPSIIYGLFGLMYVVPMMSKISPYLVKYLSWIPIFSTETEVYGKSIISVSLILSLLILPSMISIYYIYVSNFVERFRESVYAMGINDELFISRLIIPSSTLSLIDSILIGFIRAMSETSAVALIVASNYKISYHLLDAVGNTIAANISNHIYDSSFIERNALFGSSIVLVAMVFLLSIVRMIIGKLMINRHE